LDCATGEVVPAWASGPPPSCNTGAESAGVVSCDLSPIIDNLTITYRPSEDCPDPLALALERFGRDGVEWVPQERGGMNYESSCARGHVRVLWGGDSTRGTVCVQVSGQGCRQLEAEGVVSGDDAWRSFLSRITAEGARLTRLDVAWDDTRGALTLARVRDAWASGAVCTRLRDYRDIRGGQRGGRVEGETFYMGSSMSELMVRVYDKRSEQILTKGVEADALPGHWVRLELQARKSAAQGLARAYVEQGAVGLVGALRGVIDFTNSDIDDQPKQRCRRGLASWWADFVQAAERLRIRCAPALPTLAGAAAWVERQVAPVLAMLASVPSHGLSWLEGVLRAGAPRLSARHVSMLVCATTTQEVPRGALPCPA
jgi:phage replication initiation protein